MISVEWVRMMARYNAWQNDQVMATLRHLPFAELTRDRGAFFGSIFGTLNHLVWGDTLWMQRFDGGAGPTSPPSESATMLPTLGAWEAARFQLDGRIKIWAAALHEVDIIGNMEWHSASLNRDFRMARSLCITQLFNHQTHHRGQVHAMLTALGADPGVTDLPFLPGG